jgi:hypothetical protein
VDCPNFGNVNGAASERHSLRTASIATYNPNPLRRIGVVG